MLPCRQPWGIVYIFQQNGYRLLSRLPSSLFLFFLPSFFPFFLLSLLSQEVIDAGTSSTVHSYLELLLPALVGILQAPDSTEEEQQLKRQCVRVGRIVELLLDILYFGELAIANGPVTANKACLSTSKFLMEKILPSLWM